MRRTVAPERTKPTPNNRDAIHGRSESAGPFFTLLSNKYDKNRNGKITFKEYKRDKGKFESLDQDGDGVLTEAAMQADPGNPGALVDLAFDSANSENLEVRDPQRALALIRQALAIYERLIKNRRVTIRNLDTVMEQRRARRILGYVLYRCGDYKATIETLRKDQQHFWCQVFLAMSHWQLGNKGEAKSWLQKAAGQESQSRGIQESLPCQRLLAEARMLLKESR